jgi:hypothetical protein
MVVREPNGDVISPTDLPPPKERCWSARRKALVVQAVRGGLITLEQAQERYELSDEEFRQWGKDYDALGQAGLKTLRHRKRT